MFLWLRKELFEKWVPVVVFIIFISVLTVVCIIAWIAIYAMAVGVKAADRVFH